MCQEYDDPRDAYDAVRRLDGYDLDGERLLVQHSKGSRQVVSKIGDACFNCGDPGHWYMILLLGDEFLLYAGHVTVRCRSRLSRGYVLVRAKSSGRGLCVTTVNKAATSVVTVRSMLSVIVYRVPYDGKLPQTTGALTSEAQSLP